MFSIDNSKILIHILKYTQLFNNSTFITNIYGWLVNKISFFFRIQTTSRSIHATCEQTIYTLHSAFLYYLLSHGMNCRKGQTI